MGLLLIIFKKTQKNGQSEDAGSLIWLNITIYASVAMAVFLAFTNTGFFPYVRKVLARVGLLLIITSLFWGWSAILTLKKYFPVDIALHQGQQLIQAGLYKYIRHPSYLGSLVTFSGVGIALGNWLSLFLLLLPITIAFLKRIAIEENVLTEAFGDQYRNYCKRTWRLLPLRY